MASCEGGREIEEKDPVEIVDQEVVVGREKEETVDYDHCDHYD